MTIQYTDGKIVRAILLNREDHKVRVVLEKDSTVAEFRQVRGQWYSDMGEAVQVEFEWQRRGSMQPRLEPDVVSSRELASRLVYVLCGGVEGGRKRRVASAPVVPPECLVAAGCAI